MDIFLLIFSSFGGGGEKAAQTWKDRERIVQVHDVNLPENQYNAIWKNKELQIYLCSEPGYVRRSENMVFAPNRFLLTFSKSLLFDYCYYYSYYTGSTM